MHSIRHSALQLYTRSTVIINRLTQKIPSSTPGAVQAAVFHTWVTLSMFGTHGSLHQMVPCMYAIEFPTEVCNVNIN